MFFYLLVTMFYAEEPCFKQKNMFLGFYLNSGKNQKLCMFLNVLQIHSALIR